MTAAADLGDTDEFIETFSMRWHFVVPIALFSQMPDSPGCVEVVGAVQAVLHLSDQM